MRYRGGEGSFARRSGPRGRAVGAVDSAIPSEPVGDDRPRERRSHRDHRPRPAAPGARRPARPGHRAADDRRGGRPVHGRPRHRPARAPRARHADPPRRHRRPARTRPTSTGCSRSRSSPMSRSSSRRTGWPTTATARASWSTTARSAPTLDHRGLEPGRSLDRPPGAARRGRRVPSGWPSSAAATDRRRAAEPRSRDHTTQPDQPSATEGTIDEQRRIRHRERPRRQRLGAGASQRPERPLRRGRRRHDGLRAEPPPGRGRLELDEPAGRRHPPRHRRPRGLQQAPVRARASARTRRSSCTATTTTGSPRGRTGSSSCTATSDVRILNGGRKYWLDNGLAAERRRAVRTRRPATSCPSRTSACAPSATTSCRGSATRSSRSSTSARRPSSTARSSRPRA